MLLLYYTCLTATPGFRSEAKTILKECFLSESVTLNKIEKKIT